LVRQPRSVRAAKDLELHALSQSEPLLKNFEPANPSKIPTMDLSELDDHLADEIISHLLHSKPALLSLAKVSIRFSRLTRRHLYRNVHLSLVYKSYEPTNDNPIERFEQFLRTLREKPDYAKYVHFISLSWDIGTPKIHYLVNRLLSKLHNLRGLYLRGSCDTQMEPPSLEFRPSFLDENPMSNLKFVKLENDALGVALPIFLSSPSIANMEVGRMTTRDLELPLVLRTSVPLNTLSLRGCEFTKQVFGQLLGIRPNIRKLACPMPFFLGPRSPDHSLFEDCIINLQSTLEPLQDYLVEFELTGDIEAYDDFHGYRRVDFCKFTTLTTLRVFQFCLFSSRTPESEAESRKGVYSLLPPTLQHLDVSIRHRWRQTSFIGANIAIGLIYR
jgi:hypothetical protein